ncbi:MAG: phytanoyl-CoA dioxygenase family protein [Proteobacteria bacterium]|nr:phytanoyl-CoA dioxygenase family protein [Pseudomonadota bacterium]
MLDEDQVARYRRDGFIVVPDFLGPVELGALTAEVDGLIRSAEKLTGSNDIFELEDTHTPDLPRVRRINDPHTLFGGVSAFARSERLLSVLKSILGPDIRVHGSKINLKPPTGAAVAWHQDWAFYPHTNDDFLSVGVLLDDTSEANGAMMCVPRSHLGPVYDHRNPQSGEFVHAIDLDAHPIDLSEAAVLSGRAGSLTLHHGRTLHGSAPNRSNASRRFLLITYAAADAWPLLGVGDYRAYENAIVCGQSTVFPRMKELPLTVPFPVSRYGAQIFESQRGLRAKHF